MAPAISTLKTETCAPGEQQKSQPPEDRRTSGSRTAGPQQDKSSTAGSEEVGWRTPEKSVATTATGIEDAGPERRGREDLKTEGDLPAGRWEERDREKGLTATEGHSSATSQ
ncbi:hypothetical protein NDU88_008568 [Pleurodeles waltl]|uniref:Uncharacterized protein n=1 Tax=Pleurodeles waltl TaxID=8319 RepID=A0AAV7QS63_PLEWA|nr:hypothetical protein NDU88_008568 [Pleurodeles waltl]